MKRYDGPKRDDPKPVGGGSWNKHHCGDEVFNFRDVGGHYYGFCQPVGKSARLKLDKIEPSWQESALPDVVVVFVAVDPDASSRRQRVVGWYRKATVFRNRQRSLSTKRGKKRYFAKSEVRDCFLLHLQNRTEDWWAKAGKGGIGQSNVCYLYGPDGRHKKLAWQLDILEKIERHHARRNHQNSKTRRP